MTTISERKRAGSKTYKKGKQIAKHIHICKNPDALQKARQFALIVF